MSNPRTVSTREAAATLGVTPRTVARWVEDGVITPSAYFPMGNSRAAYLFNADDIERLADERTAEATR